MEFYENLMPPGMESREGHIGSTDCPCGPSIITYEGKPALFHKYFDNREVWYGVEMMLGYTCTEHALRVDKTYVSGMPHDHIEVPEPLFEYEHEKIDPR